MTFPRCVCNIKRCCDLRGHGTAFFILLSFFVRENAVVSRKKCNFAI